MYKIIGQQEKAIRNLGGKGLNLIKLDKLDLTPNFFIITNSIFKEYVKKDSLLSEYLRNNSSDRVNIKFVRKRILNFKPDRDILNKINSAQKQLKIKKFIIRSSYIFEDSKDLSYAGLFDSYVCYKKDDIFTYIKKVWASQFNERALSYQKEKNNFQQGMAVIVQDFIKPDFSGVVFSQQNKYQEILVEYCEKSYRGIESGTKTPFVYLQRDSYSYLSSAISKSHSEWIDKLIEKVLVLKKKEDYPLDIEFAVSKDMIYLLQLRPLTKKVETKGIFFVFERHQRWKYHLSDFSVSKFKKILKELNIHSPLKIEERMEGIFIESNSYFSFIEEIKEKSKDLKFLNDFFQYFKEFILSQYIRTKRNFKELVPLISAVKELNFRMSIIDFIHNLVVKNLKEFLIKKYNINESRNFEYFAPPLSFTTYSFLLHYKGGKKIPDSYDKELLERLDKSDLNKLLSQIKANQEKVFNILKKLKGKQKKYFTILKKLIWLCDMVDYYYDVITLFYGRRLSLILNRENIKCSFKDFLVICRFSMDEIQKIKKDKICPIPDFLIKKKQKNAYQEKYTFPLKGIIASQGNFSGIVKVIKNFSDIKKVTTKDILISHHTRPSLVIGMAICKGIITEEGGLTSHAAIVSRELGKPCLIGVKGCINALKNGDKIKVTNGRIYKLK